MTAPLQSLFCRRKREVKRNLDLAAKYDAKADECERNGFAKQADRWRYSAESRRRQSAIEQALLDAMTWLNSPGAYEQIDVTGHVATINEPTRTPTPPRVRRTKRGPLNVEQMALPVEVIAA